jgi:nucleoside-diphosphate-sugar epimerase
MTSSWLNGTSRATSVFGERQDPISQYAAVIPSFIGALLSGERPVIYGNGEQTRDFTYVGNVVEGTMLALHAEGAAGKIFNVAAGEQTSVRRLLEELQTITGTQVEPRQEPARPRELMHSHADISHAEHELGYRPTVSLSDGLRRTAEHYETLAAVQSH